MGSTTVRRKRRSTEEVRDLLLGAARELFIANGYDGTTTREICAKAGVARNLLPNNFTNKQQLFEAAVLAPFAEFLDSYVRAWEQDSSDSTPEQLIAGWVEGMYDLTEQNRALLATSIARRITGGEGADHGIVDALGDMFDGLMNITQTQGKSRFANIDPPVSIGVAASMVIGAVLLKDLAFRPDRCEALDRARITREITTMILHGIEHRPA